MTKRTFVRCEAGQLLNKKATLGARLGGCMNANELIELLERKTDVSGVIENLPLRLLKQRGVLVALMSHFNEHNVKAFYRRGVALYAFNSNDMFFSTLSPEFLDFFFRTYPAPCAEMQHDKNKKAQHFFECLTQKVVLEDTWKAGRFDHYVALVQAVARNASVNASGRVAYFYGAHWTAQHWDFFHTYCANGSWKETLREEHKRAHPDPALRQSLLRFIAAHPPWGAWWAELEETSARQQAECVAFAAEFAGGRETGAALPFLQKNLSSKDMCNATGEVHPELLWDLDGNCVVTKGVDQMLGFDVADIFLYGRLHFYYFSSLNKSLPVVGFPTYDHQQVAAFDKMVCQYTPKKVFELMQNPLTRRLLLRDCTLKDVQHILQAEEWTHWRDEVGNTIAHLMWGFCRSLPPLKLLNFWGKRHSGWLTVRNNAGFALRDLLGECDFEDEAEFHAELVALCDRFVLKAAVKPRRKAKSKRKI